MSFFFLFLILYIAQSKPTSWLIDKGGFDVLVEGKEDVAVMPTAPSLELNELMLNLTERRSWIVSHQGPSLLLALAKVVTKEYEKLGNVMDSL